MRPTKHPQSALRCPLNHILGTEANVRVLRVLFLSPVPLGIAELARQTALQASGLSRVCANLEDLGVIETVGRGRNRQFWRRQVRPLVQEIATLFGVEQSRAEQILGRVRAAAQASSGSIGAAWLEGPVADRTDGPGDAIIVGALVDDAAVESVRDQIWAQLLVVQEELDVSIELRLMTQADLRTADESRLRELERAQPLVGAPPIELARPAAPDRSRDPIFRAKRHESVDRRLLRIATAIAERLKRDPSLVQRAMDHVERRLLTASGSERLALREWQALLRSNSAPRLRRLLVQDDARARRLRQSLPFVDVLSPDERKTLLRDVPERR